MPEKLTDFAFSDRRGQFAGLLDGSVWKVSLDDYPGYSNLIYLCSGIRAAAALQDLRVRTKKLDKRTCVIQAYSRDSEWWEE